MTAYLWPVVFVLVVMAGAVALWLIPRIRRLWPGLEAADREARETTERVREWYGWRTKP
jgi:hypothetical protein